MQIMCCNCGGRLFFFFFFFITFPSYNNKASSKFFQEIDEHSNKTRKLFPSSQDYRVCAPDTNGTAVHYGVERVCRWAGDHQV